MPLVTYSSTDQIGLRFFFCRSSIDHFCQKNIINFDQLVSGENFLKEKWPLKQQDSEIHVISSKPDQMKKIQ